MKRDVRKQLKGDEFVSTINKIVHFFETRTKEIVIGLCALAAVALVFVGLRLLQSHSLTGQSASLGEMLALRSTLAAQPANLAKLEKLEGKGKYGRLAYVLVATYWVEKGDLAKARELLSKVAPTPRDFIYFQAEDLLGKVDTLEKKYDDAVAVYDRLVKEKPGDYSLDVILYHKAEALEAKGDKKAALDVYKKLQQDFPQSYYGYDATERLRKLEQAGPASL